MDVLLNTTHGNMCGIKEEGEIITCQTERCEIDRDSEVCSCTNLSNKTSHEDEIVQWYVLRFLYRNQPKIRVLFESEGIESFSPMKWVRKIENGKQILKYDYAIWDLFFVHSSKKVIDPYVNRFENLQYKFQSGGKQHNPMVVPDKQMSDFIKAIESSKKPLYFAPHEIDLLGGESIRIIGGTLNGYVGKFVKVKGSRQKRLIIELSGMLCAAVEVEPDLVEVLK